MKDKLKNLKYKVAKWLIHRSSTAMQIVIEWRNEVANQYEHYLDVANDDISKLRKEISKLEYEKGLSVLDKIRAEIEELARVDQCFSVDRANTFCWCLDVIDKHIAELKKAESEGE